LNRTCMREKRPLLGTWVSNVGCFLVYFPHFEKIKGSLWGYLAVCVSVYCPPFHFLYSLCHFKGK
jgi:hypothetical protein